ncbi:MAG: SGNH/GDSL hydrolase family protein [Ginsengibacter sp.]
MSLSRRRDFLKSVTTLGIAAAASSQNLIGKNYHEKGRPEPVNDLTFLFQGDSITDGNRSRDNDWNHVMGHGYQYIIASKLWYDFPGRGLHFFNRGVSGNKITDLADRWQSDTLALRPDVLSILIGINDIEAWIHGDQISTPEKYESGYRSLLEKTKQELPNVQLVLGEPFLFPVGRVKDKWEEYLSEVQKRQAIVKRLSNDFAAIHIKYQSSFNKALEKAPPEYWIWDGIHPMPAGHELMALEWMKQVNKKMNLYVS